MRITFPLALLLCFSKSRAQQQDSLSKPPLKNSTDVYIKGQQGKEVIDIDVLRGAFRLVHPDLSVVIKSFNMSWDSDNAINELNIQGDSVGLIHWGYKYVFPPLINSIFCV